MSSPAVIEFLNPEDVTSTSRRWDVGEPTIVGRGADASIVLNVAAISRHHLRLTPQPRGWYASDLNSRNGTHLNGVAIGDEPVRLHDSDLLVLAGSVTLRFRDPMATPIAPRIGRLVGVWIDPETDAVWVDARRVEPPLSARQLRLLKLMYNAEGNIITRAEAIDAAWDDANAEGVTDDALAALIKRTRKRLADFENDEPNIEIVRNRGIRLRNVQ